MSTPRIHNTFKSYFRASYACVLRLPSNSLSERRLFVVYVIILPLKLTPAEPSVIFLPRYLHSHSPGLFVAIAQSDELNHLLRLQHDNIVDILFHFYTASHGGKAVEVRTDYR